LALEILTFGGKLLKLFYGEHMKKLSMLIVLGSFLAGCTTAGPYVTNISSDGNNGLNIEKCGVQMNAFTGTVSNVDCLSQSIRLSR